MLLTELLELREAYKLLAERVTALEDANRPRTTRDELSERITAFMSRLPGVKLSPTVIGQNLGEPDNMKVRNRLAALERRGVLQVTKEDGRNQLWHWPVSR